MTVAESAAAAAAASDGHKLGLLEGRHLHVVCCIAVLLLCQRSAVTLTLCHTNIVPPSLILCCAMPFHIPSEYLETTASYITEAPFPQLWMQGSPSEPATTTQMPVPTQHAAWFDAGEACSAPQVS